MTKEEAENLAKYAAAARKLVLAGWTQGCVARDAKGASVDINSADATRFCMVGALARARRGADVSCVETAFWRRFADDNCVGTAFSVWNDTAGRTAAEVVVMLQKLESAARREAAGAQ